jgi:hypothetical protein
LRKRRIANKRPRGKPLAQYITLGGKTMNKLNTLNEWADKASAFFAPKSAQGYLQPAMAAAGSCGAGDDGKKEEKPKPSACGAGDEKPKK